MNKQNKRNLTLIIKTYSTYGFAKTEFPVGFLAKNLKRAQKNEIKTETDRLKSLNDSTITSQTLTERDHFCFAVVFLWPQ